MTLTNETITAILNIAKSLQTNYDLLGAPATQNVRNPYPLNKLVIGALPRGRRGLTKKQIHAKLTGYGYTVQSGNLSVVLWTLLKKGVVRARRVSKREHRNGGYAYVLNF